MGNEADDSIRIIQKALDSGINLIDTADAYGDSEDVVGPALRGRRESVVLATKVGRPVGEDPTHQGASPRWIMKAVENSLRRLQTDYIDLYQVHRPDPDTDIEETLSVLTDLVRSGKIRAFGTSMLPASDIVEAQWIAERRGLHRLRSEQPPYSILNRGIEREVLPVAQRYGMGVLVWGPLAQGMLTGRVRRGQDTDVSGAKIMPVFRDERRLDAVERLIPLAEDAGLSMPHMAMAFAISHPAVSCALLGARTTRSCRQEPTPARSIRSTSPRRSRRSNCAAAPATSAPPLEINSPAAGSAWCRCPGVCPASVRSRALRRGSALSR
jgi:aryl-alcohol dehydrogenase-like predicted oxidoreductase